MRGDNRLRGQFRNLENRGLAQMRDADHHPEAVHLLDNGNPEFRKLRTHLRIGDSLPKSVSAVVSQLETTHPETEKLVQHRHLSFRIIVVSRFRLRIRDGSSALHIEEKLDFSSIWLLRDVSLCADNGYLSVRFFAL